MCVNTEGSSHCDCREGYRLFGSSFCTGIVFGTDFEESMEKRPLQILMSAVKGSTHAIEVHPHLLAVSTLKGATGVHVMSTLRTVCLPVVPLVKVYISLQHRVMFQVNIVSDVDECAEDPSLCRETCVNTRGSYSCTCPEGFDLDVDQISCRG